MSSMETICILCKNTCHLWLIHFQQATWQTATNAARRRLSLKNDKFGSVTKDSRSFEIPKQSEKLLYHSKCFSQLCAIKRGKVDDVDPCEPPRKTRSTYELPSSSRLGVLGKQCLFCKKKRKTVGRTVEGLHQCLTKAGANSIISAAKQKNDPDILGIGEDLIAKEARYHNTYRRVYVRQDSKQKDDVTKRKHHDEAFKNVTGFIKNESIDKKTPMMLNTIFNMYKEEFIDVGGSKHDFEMYRVQPFTIKLKERFDNIVINKLSNKSGNFIFPSLMTSAEACLLLNGFGESMEKIRCTAITLRTEILSIPSSNPPSPMSVHTLKTSSPKIPEIPHIVFWIRHLMLRLVTLFREKHLQVHLIPCSTALEEELGLGLSTLNGSKTVLNILNRFGHCISYDDVKRLETEMAYSCCEGD